MACTSWVLCGLQLNLCLQEGAEVSFSPQIIYNLGIINIIMKHDSRIYLG